MGGTLAAWHLSTAAQSRPEGQRESGDRRPPGWVASSEHLPIPCTGPASESLLDAGPLFLRRPWYVVARAFQPVKSRHAACQPFHVPTTVPCAACGPSLSSQASSPTDSALAFAH